MAKKYNYQKMTQHQPRKNARWLNNVLNISNAPLRIHLDIIGKCSVGLEYQKWVEGGCLLGSLLSHCLCSTIEGHLSNVVSSFVGSILIGCLVC